MLALPSAIGGLQTGCATDRKTIFANGVVYFTTVASGKLIALDTVSGAVLKEIRLGPVWSGPSVSHGRIYVGTGNTQLTPSEKEAFFPKTYTGVLYSFGLPGEDEVSRLGAGKE